MSFENPTEKKNPIAQMNAHHAAQQEAQVQQQAAPIYQPQAAEQVAPEVQVKETAMSANDIFSDLGISTTTGNASHADLIGAVDQFRALTKESKNTDQKATVILVNDTVNLAMPIILIAYGNAQSAVYYSVLIEGLLYADFQRRLETIENMQVEIDVVASKCHDRSMEEVLRQVVCGAYKAPAAFEVGYTVLPATVALTDAAAVKAIYDTAEMALVDTMKTERSVKALTAKTLSNDQLTVSAMNELTPGANTKDILGRPVTSDITVTMEVRPANVNKDNLNGGNRRMVLSKVSAFLDFIYAPTEVPRNAMGMMQGQQQVAMPGYHPLLIISDSCGLNANSGRSTETLLTHLLGAASMGGIASDGAWTSFFERHVGKDVKASIGNFGYEHNPYPGMPHTPAEIQVEAAVTGSTDAVTVREVASTYCHNTMTVGIDIEHGGRASWAQNLLLLAAAPGGERANAAIIAELDAFTGGAFSQCWSGPVVQKNPVTIHLGSYYNDQDQERDIRDFNYTTMLSLLKTNAATGIIDYAVSFEPGKDTLASLHRRRVILENIASGFKPTGLASRVLFADGFIDAILLACSHAGMSVRTDGLYKSAGQATRGAGFAAGSAINGDVVRGVFGQGPVHQNNPIYNRAPATSSYFTRNGY